MRSYVFSFFIFLLVGFSSCTIHKRVYRDGFYIGRNETGEKKTIHPGKSAFYKNNKNVTSITELFISRNEINPQEVSGKKNNSQNLIFSPPIILVKKYDSRDSLRNKKRQKKSIKNPPGKIDTGKASKLTFKIFLAGLGLTLIGALLAIGIGFRYDTSLQALGMLTAVILIGVGAPLFIYGTIALIVLGIIILTRRHKEKKAGS